ncbi:ABC transporter ATP-binding protein [Ruania zhangjianzhongii]|uniref:ABC transporter ATP-binding protein n=1 Tax=Ruania zhangjianzhongii TaxID=2603206 RepID=UPI0011CC50EC|nr:ABC transporter ATP-binding protein [Ruania zhangjianzhongii]
MIDLDQLSVRYGAEPVLHRIDAHIPEGEMCLVIGPTGSGKSTLLGAIAARVPHLSGGTVSGRVQVGGRDTRHARPRDLADLVGVVAQDPRSSFVTDTVEDELAFTMEQLGVPEPLMRRRVEDVLDLLDLAGLRRRQLATLSGGEAQRVAIGAVLTAQPRVLVLDEPTSALDPGAAEDVLAALARLTHDAALTVVLAEHRLERVAGFADRVLALEPGAEGATARSGTPGEILATSLIAPPVTRLGRLAGWQPAPVTVRDARRRAGELRTRVSSAVVGEEPEPGEEVLRADHLQVRYGSTPALTGVDLSLRAGTVTAVMGRNGAGKSTLLWTLAGAQRPDAGRVHSRHRAVLVPQSPEDLLYRLTVDAETAAADELAEPGSTRTVLDQLTPDIPGDANPRDLSEGQRLALAVAIQLAARPRLLLLDEPTRGLDYAAKEHLAAHLDRLRRSGHAVLVASHDVEFVALVADRLLQLAEGQVVADGPARTLLTDSMLTAPQVARVLAPVPLLTVGEVRVALEQGG